MAAQTETKNMALFCDFENVALGVQEAKYAQFDIRKVLERAIRKSDKPMMARFYLGRVERILGRVREALVHFKQVVEIEPGHADAAAEIRMLEPRMASERRR